MTLKQLMKVLNAPAFGGLLLAGLIGMAQTTHADDHNGCPPGTIRVIANGTVVEGNRVTCVRPPPNDGGGGGGGGGTPTPRAYHAGICPRPLEGIPIAFGPLRHDDVQSYRSGRSEESTSGFYATDMGAAIDAAWKWVLNRKMVYVAGHHEHSSTSTCTLSFVSEDVFNDVRSNASTIIWTDYHLLRRNCQDWAAEVTEGLL